MDLVCLGEFIMDMLAVETDCGLADVAAFKPTPGGAPANVAVAGSRLGCSAAFLGMVGDDVFGRRLADTLAQERVNTRGMRFTQQARTTLNFIALPEVNHPEFLFYRNPGADTQLSTMDLDVDVLTETRIFHFGSLSLSQEPIRSATLYAIAAVRAVGAYVSFDVNYRPTCWYDPEAARESIFSVIPQADLLKMNQDELSFLCREQELDAACLALLQRGPSLCVITLGASGCYFRTASGGGLVPGFSVDACDASGCGDAFSAALLYQLLQGEPGSAEGNLQRLADSLRFANAAGAITATVHGVIPALPSLEQIHTFLKRSYC